MLMEFADTNFPLEQGIHEAGDSQFHYLIVNLSFNQLIYKYRNRFYSFKYEKNTGRLPTNLIKVTFSDKVISQKHEIDLS